MRLLITSPLFASLLMVAGSASASSGAFSLSMHSSSCTSESRRTRELLAGREGWTSSSVEVETIRGGRPGLGSEASSISLAFDEVESLRESLLAAPDCIPLADSSLDRARRAVHESPTVSAARAAARLQLGRPLLESLGITRESVAAARERILLAASRGEPVSETNEEIERLLSYEEVAVSALDTLSWLPGAGFWASTLTVDFPGEPTLQATVRSGSYLSVSVEGREKTVCDPRSILRVRRLWSPALEEKRWPDVFFDQPAHGWSAIRRQLDWLEARRQWSSIDGWRAVDEHFELLSAVVENRLDSSGGRPVLQGRFRVREPSRVDAFSIDARAREGGWDVSAESVLASWREAQAAMATHAWLDTWKEHWPDSVITLDRREHLLPFEALPLAAWQDSGQVGPVTGRLLLRAGTDEVPDARLLVGRAGEPLLLVDRNHGVLGEHWFDALSASHRSNRLVAIGPRGQVTKIEP